MTGRIVATGIVIAVALASPALFAPLQLASLYDSGITSSAGTFIRHGLVPYRDFWMLYGPLSGYIAAAIGYIARDDVLPLRIAGLTVVGATAGAATWITRRRATSVVAVALGALVAVAPIAYWGLDLSALPLATLFVLAAIAVAEHGRPKSLVLAGILCGVAGLARQDVGVYGLVAVSIAYRSPRPLVGALSVWAPVGLWLLLAVPVSTLWAQLVAFPLFGQAQFRAIAPASPTALLGIDDWLRAFLFYLPFALILATMIKALRVRAIDPLTSALLVLAILLRPQAIVRADAAHAVITLAPALLLAPYVARGLLTSFGRRLAAGVVLAPLASVALAALLLPFKPTSPYATTVVAAAEIVRGLTMADEPIFVGLAQNRHTFSNPLIAYYLADRQTGVRDSLYNPGVTNTDETQRRIAADLVARGVRFLILDVQYAYCWEPENASRIPGSSVLDARIAKDYRPIADLGTVIIMGRRDVTADLGPIPAPVIPEIPRTEGALVCGR